MLSDSDIINIQSNPKIYANNLDIKSLEKIILYFNDLYYNNEILSQIINMIFYMIIKIKI